MTDSTAPAPQHTFLGRMLDTIERVGNKVPHPAIIFIILIAGVSSSRRSSTSRARA